MTIQQVDRILELQAIIGKSNSFSEIYRSCKEIIAIQEGTTYESPKPEPPQPPKNRILIEGQEPEKP